MYLTAEVLLLAEHKQSTNSVFIPSYKQTPSDSNRKQSCLQANTVLTAHTLWVEKSRLQAAFSEIYLRCMQHCISVIHQREWRH